MLRALSAGEIRGPALGFWLAGRSSSPIGLRMLVPGLLQCRWGQRQRGWVFFGSFASAFLVGLWAWGSPLSLGFSCAGVRDAHRVGHRCASPGVVSGLSGQASDVSRLWSLWRLSCTCRSFTGLIGRGLARL